MEQHKVLLIIVSVAIVLAAVVGVGLWLFYPRSADDAVVARDNESGGYEWQPLDYLQGQGGVPGLEEDQGPSANLPREFEVTYGVVPGAESAGTSGSQTVPGSTLRAPSVNVTEATGAGDQSSRTDASRTDTTAVVAPPATVRSSTTTSAAPSVADRASGSASPIVQSSATAESELADQAYWVQAISSPHRDTVEQSQLTLREHQLGSRIMTKVIDGQTYYRLRVGPFSVRAEAEKFLGWVQEIDDFADAMVFVDYTTPVLAARAN